MISQNPPKSGAANELSAIDVILNARIIVFHNLNCWSHKGEHSDGNQ
jgi:hypothetical protein